MKKPVPIALTPKTSKLAKQPDTAIYHGHREWYIVSFICAIILLITSSYLAHRQGLLSWETRSFRWINDWPNSLHTYFKIVSIAKESTLIAVIAVVGAFIFRRWRLAWRLAATTVAGFALIFLLKHFIDRPRPAGLLSDVHLRWTDTGNGFPSGHVMVVTVILLTLIPYLPKMWRWIVPAGIILMALSRPYLGLHAPLDVIGGFAAGLLVVSFVRIMPQALRVFFRLD